MELKLYIKQKILIDKTNGQQRHIALKNKRLEYVSAPLPANRQFPNYGQYIDVTADVSDLHKLKLTWTLERNSQGLSVAGSTNQKKAASGTLNFEGTAYRYLKQWLIDDESGLFNEVEVQIADSATGKYNGWVIKSTDIQWCEGELCVLDASLKQREEPITCIKNTLITDNHQGWFGETNRPWSGKRHPRFSYCNEIRPNALLVTIWWTMVQLMSILGPTILIIASIVNFTLLVIVSVLNVINFGLKIMKNLPGGGKIKTLDDEIQKLKDKEIKHKDVKDIFGNFFVETAACGREHPAPLIRDYISNVCSKCGVEVTPDTAPIFFSQTILLETSVDRDKGIGAQWHDNPHYNACYFHPVVDKGVRRYDDLNIFKGAQKNLTDWWLPGNTPILSLDMLLDELKTLYNAEWRVVDNKLYFKRKDYWLDNKDAFDFSEKGKDRSKLIEGICYEWDETKTPLYGKGLYTADAADVAGNAAIRHVNGLVSFADITKNPATDGVMDKTTKFSPTKFRLDGASNDYVFDAMQQVLNTQFITGSIWTRPLFKTVSGFFDEFADYALLLTKDTTTLPKVLIWDGNSFENAKCVRPYDGTVTLGRPTPPANEKYNPDRRLWEHAHVPETKVLGNKLSTGLNLKTIYDVRGLFGGEVITKAPKLMNYPLYFEPGYVGTMWDWFHFIDDPNENNRRHMKYTAKMDLCKKTVDHIQATGDGTNIILGQKIKLPGNEPNTGRISEIEISWDVSSNSGPYVQLKGTV